ncbi:MAG: hypothetical protein SVU32_02885 [Candidatus Nanohaloarchaea archaeon]|nr:hypothetical protein [Candidatus Nanohaloarchaea archaeon]
MADDRTSFEEETETEIAGDVNEMAEQLMEQPGFYERRLRPLLRWIEIVLPVLSALGAVIYMHGTRVPDLPVEQLHLDAAIIGAGLVGSIILLRGRDRDQSYAKGPGSRLDLEDE